MSCFRTLNPSTRYAIDHMRSALVSLLVKAVHLPPVVLLNLSPESAMAFLYALEQVTFLLDLAMADIWCATELSSCLRSWKFDAKTFEVGPVDTVARRGRVVQRQPGQVPVHLAVRR